MLRSSKRLAPVAFAAVLASTLLLLSGLALALARPGGGHAFGSGGGGSGGSSSTGGGGFGHAGSGDASFAPSTLSGAGTMVLVVVALGLVGVLVIASGAASSGDDGAAKGPIASPRRRKAKADRTSSARARLRRLEGCDPSFSVAVFEDFSCALYTEIALAAGRGELTKLRPYLSSDALSTLSTRPLAGVSTVLVGGMTIRDVSNVDGPSDKVSVEIEIEANLAHRDETTGDEKAVYVVERWVLRRAKTARSRAPDRARIFACPSCSAPLEALLAGGCRYCEEDVTTGAFDWVVCSVRVVHERERGPVLGGHCATEADTTPSIVGDDVRAQFDETVAQGDDGAYEAFLGHVTRTFTTFHEAWSARDLEPTQHLTTDALFVSQTYWMSEYEKQGLRNVTEDAAIVRVELARVTRDPYFDAITVRIHARAKDYTIDDGSGEVVSGDPASATSYREYWTFLRKRPTDDPRGRSDCPRCGAPRTAEAGGHCSHCEAKVSNRSVGWVLSRIEQDDAYGG